MRALVTGAGGRLGRAMALYLARRGADVAVHYAASQDGAEATAAEIRALGRQAVTVLVNNASIFEQDTIQTATRQSWDRHIESNLRAPYVLIQHFARQAPQAETDSQGEPMARALVVNMIDQRIHKLTPEFSRYPIAQMGLWALTRTAALAAARAAR